MKNPTLPSDRGVRIAGTGSFTPDKLLTNDDLAQMVETSDEWITQRTGIKQRRICEPGTEGTFSMAREALGRAIDDSGIDPKTLDLVIVGTVTPDMTCPSTSARLTAEFGATPAAEATFELLTDEPLAATEYVDDDVTPGQTYTYRVEAVDEAGNASDGAEASTEAR